jgi:hypothetical protein
MKYIYEKKDQWEKSTSGADTFRKKFLNPAVSCLEKRAVLRNTSIQIPINSCKIGPTLIIPYFQSSVVMERVPSVC